MSDERTYDRCPYCDQVYAYFDELEPKWCRVCPEGARDQSIEDYWQWREANREFDRAEAEYLRQR